MMKRYLSLAALLLAAFACGEKNNPVDPVPENPAPTAITLSGTAFSVAQGGESPIRTEPSRTTRFR